MAQADSETLHLPQLHLCRSAAGYYICYLCSSVLNTHSTGSPYALAASYCTCSSSSNLQLQQKPTASAIQLQQHSTSILPRANTLTLSYPSSCLNLPGVVMIESHFLKMWRTILNPWLLESINSFWQCSRRNGRMELQSTAFVLALSHTNCS